MAYVQSSRCKKYSLLTTYGDEPTLHIESEGDRLIHDLTAKQLDTNLTFEKLKKSEKLFERGSGFVPLSVHSAGCSSLQELQDKVSREEKLEKLQILGLTLKEANAVLNEEDLSFPESKVETSVKNTRAEQIKNVIESQKHYSIKEKAKAGEEAISRHERELALAVKPESTETKLLQFALSCQSGQNIEKDIRPPEHPINRLHELEESLFCKHDPLQLARTVKRKRIQLLESCLPPIGPKFMKTSEKGERKSLWDQEEQSCVKGIGSSEGKAYTCKRQTFYTIKNGEIVEIRGRKSVPDVSDKPKNNCDSSLHGSPFINLFSSASSDGTNDKLMLSRLTEEEIKNLPRFKDYQRGKPSKVLYIKNLANNIKEDDLVQLFKKFQKPNQPHLIYRLMNGKMRGQAFVTFPNDKDSEDALNEINGTIIKGKPVVIQFGKSTCT